MRTYYDNYTEEISINQNIMDLCYEDKNLFASINEYYSDSCDGRCEIRSYGY